MSNLTVSKASAVNLGKVPIIEGQMIFVPDAKQIYFDYGGFRQYYCQPLPLTESERGKIENPVGYYFTTDTNTLWYYDSEWHRGVGTTNSNIVFDTLPEIGDEKTLYIDDQGVKRYSSGQYKVVANVSSWGNL